MSKQMMFTGTVHYGLPSIKEGEKGTILKFQKGSLCPPEFYEVLAHTLQEVQHPVAPGPSEAEIKEKVRAELLAEAEARKSDQKANRKG